MKQPRKYQRRAQQYRLLAKGYSALKSKLAGPAVGAAEAFEQMAHQAGRAADREQLGKAEHGAERHP